MRKRDEKLERATRDTAKGVEEKAVPEGTEDREEAAGLIGNGQMVDPRYIGQR